MNLLLLGSMKGMTSASFIIGKQVFSSTTDLQIRTLGVDGTTDVMDLLRQSTLLLLVSPLYFDGLPSTVVGFMEDVLCQNEEVPVPGRFGAIINCGFPESSQTATAIEMCRLFAQKAGMHWVGGAGMGMGPLAGVRWFWRLFMYRRKNALRAIGVSLLQGGEMPGDCIRELALPPIPPSLYRFLSTIRRKGR